MNGEKEGKMDSIYQLYSKASNAKNKITLHSIPLIVLPCALYLAFGFKLYGIFDQLSQVSGLKRAYLMMNAGIVNIQLGVQLIVGIHNWELRNPRTRYGLILAIVHPILVFLTGYYINPSLTMREDSAFALKNPNLITITTSVSLYGLTFCIYLISTLCAHIIDVILSLTFALYTWDTKKTFLMLIVRIALGVVLLLGLFAMV